MMLQHVKITMIKQLSNSSNKSSSSEALVAASRKLNASRCKIYLANAQHSVTSESVAQSNKKKNIPNLLLFPPFNSALNISTINHTAQQSQKKAWAQVRTGQIN